MNSITIKQIAQQANVSISTVSRVLNHYPYIKPSTRKKVESVIQKNKYTANYIASGLRLHKSTLLGLVIPDTTNIFFKEVADSIERNAKIYGFSVITINTEQNTISEINAINQLKKYQVAGIVIAPSTNKIDYKKVLEQFPTVFFDRLPNKQPTQSSTILVNNTLGARLAVDELFRCGAKKIGAIYHDLPTVGIERLKGYKDALNDYGKTINNSLIRHVTFDYHNIHENICDILIRQNCDGIFVSDQTILMQLLDVLKLKDQNHLKIACFDDYGWLNYLRFPINSVRQPTEQIGFKIVDELVNQIQKTGATHRVQKLQVQLIRRA